MRSIVVLFTLLSGCAIDDGQPSNSTHIIGNAVAGANIGESCSEVACANELMCVGYYGIAGSRGALVETCEMACRQDADCPVDRRCVILTDGPGRVCR